jgi:hypothetical protein
LNKINNVLLSSSVFSLIYYNSEMWHILTLNPLSRQQLVSVSARALKWCYRNITWWIHSKAFTSFSNSATPNATRLYKHLILLYKLYYSHKHSMKWTWLNVNQILTSCVKPASMSTIVQHIKLKFAFYINIFQS